MKKYSILITTKNRLAELKITLSAIKDLIKNNDVETIIYDDGSSDNTTEYLNKNFKNITLFRNHKSKGLIYCRNKMLNHTSAKYAISLDDDANFISENVLETIDAFFIQNPNCGVGAFRIFWGIDKPKNTLNYEKRKLVKGFVGCGHVWNMKAWKEIPNYPDWFIFYGEEEFASYQLFKKGWTVNYLPEVLVHHRVSLKSRKNNKDYQIRLRRSLRAGWYLYFLFYPLQFIPKRLLFSVWVQLKLKVFKGDLKALAALIQAFGDLFCNIPRLLRNSNRLTLEEYQRYCKLPDTNVYWNPNEKN